MKYINVLRPTVMLLLAAAASSFIPAPALAAPGAVLWEAVYSTSPGRDSDQAEALALDRQGSLLVTGHIATKEGNTDYLTVKYKRDGTTAWVRLYDASWYDASKAVATDGAGNVFVAGASYDLYHPKDNYSGAYYTDYRVIKYDPSGNPLGEMTASGFNRGNTPVAIAVDGGRNVFVTGTAKDATGSADLYYTVRFGPDGKIGWERPENVGTEAEATGLALDSDGSVLVTGHVKDFQYGNYIIRTFRYSPDGRDVLMDVVQKDFYMDQKAWGIATAPDGGFVITGETSDEGGITQTLKYSARGELLWTGKYNSSGLKNRGNAVTTDSEGRVYVAGKTLKDDQTGDILLLVYDKDGRPLLDKTFAFGGDSSAEGVAVELDGNIVLTGYTRPQDGPAVIRTMRVEGFLPSAPAAKAVKAVETVALQPAAATASRNK